MRQEAKRIVEAVGHLGREQREDVLVALHCFNCVFLATCEEGQRLSQQTSRRLELAREIDPQAD